MKVLSFVACALTCVCLTSAAKQASDGFTYHVAGSGWLQMAAVCNADPDDITCWAPSGAPAPKVSELINAYFLVNPQQRLEIRYKHRTLMLVMKSMLNNGSGQGGVNFNGIEVDPGGNVYQQFSIGYGGQGEESTTAYWYYPPDSLNSIDVSATLNSTTPSAKLALKVGETAQLAGGRVKITKIEKSSDRSPSDSGSPDPNSPKGPVWTVRYELQGEGSDPVTSVFASPFNEDGMQITQVDNRGNPVMPKPFNGYNGFRGMPNYQLVMAGSGRFVLRINPDKIDYLLVSGSTQHKATFKGVALQPSK